TVLQQAGAGWVWANGSGENSVYRNRAQIPPDKLPALVLLDGSESISGPPIRDSMGLVPNQAYPQNALLKPQVFVVLKVRDTTANTEVNGQPAPVGPELSMMRMKLLQMVMKDDGLQSLVGANGGIKYMGHETDLQTGSTVEGQMQLNFEFAYVLNPSDYLN